MKEVGIKDLDDFQNKIEVSFYVNDDFLDSIDY